jgi:predicted N-acyltransferase
VVPVSDVRVETYETIDAVDTNQWNNLVTQSALGSVFQRTEWLRAMEQCLGHEARHVVVWDDENPAGLCPNFMTTARVPDSVPDIGENLVRECVSTPSPGFGGPVIVRKEEETFDLLVDTIADSCGPSVLSHYIKTLDMGYARYARRLHASGYDPYIGNCRFRLPLWRDLEDIEAIMHKDRRRNIREARDTDSTVERLEDPTGETLADFYADYQAAMDRVDGSVIPRAFFETIFETFPERVAVYAARHDGDAVGYHVYVRDEEQATIHHLFAAVRAENFEHYPSELIHDHVIRENHGGSYRWYDFGDTGARFDDGLFKYKEQYGGDVVPTIIWERGQSPVWPLYSTARKRYFGRSK